MWKENHSSAYNFSPGLTIAVIGLSLTAQTDYDTNAALRYHFKRTRKLCGTGDYPGGTPHLLVARPLS